MSVAYRNAEEILDNPNRWECDEGSNKAVIFIDEAGSFRICRLSPDGDKWYVNGNLDYSLWFKTYAAARKYGKDEMFVEGSFKKVKKHMKTDFHHEMRN